ncbi:MAG: LysE family transporter [Chlamydiota bacterium]
MHESLVFIKGFCSGIFYTFIPTCGVMIIGHFTGKKRTRSSVTAALGMVCAQLIWAVIAWIGFLLITSGLEPKTSTLTLIGAMILFLLAAKVYHRQEHLDLQHELKSRFWASFGVGFMFSLSSPSRILGHFALFAVLQVPPTPLLETSLALFTGLFAGSFAFWLFFTAFMISRKKTLSPKSLQQLHKFSAFVLAAFTALGLFKIYL